MSTVRAADQVLFVDSGQLIARGTFEEVRMQVPAFNLQVSLLGLQ